MRMTREFWLAHLAAIEQEGISTHAYAKRHALGAKPHRAQVMAPPSLRCA